MMSRVHYKNETIDKAMRQLDNLEQTIGFNMRCAYPGDYRPGDDYHQGAMSALVQILKHFPKMRSLLDEVEAEVLKCFLEAQQVEKKLPRRSRGRGEGQGLPECSRDG
jgi:hypothetical protein